MAKAAKPACSKVELFFRAVVWFFLGGGHWFFVFCFFLLYAEAEMILSLSVTYFILPKLFTMKRSIYKLCKRMCAKVIRKVRKGFKITP